jgi:putative ABC transport system substrate-binding protein
MCAIKKAGVLSLLFVMVLLAVAVMAEAQQAEKVFRIGYLGSSGSDPPPGIPARPTGPRLRRRARARTLFLSTARQGVNLRGIPDLAAELVRLRVDVIIGEGAGAIGAAKNASTTIPIVMAHVNDPIVLGLVANLARPGGNITGISNLSPELSGKRLELLKEVIPKVYRVAVLAYRGAAMQTSIKATEAAAQSLRLQLQLLEVKAPDEIESAFDAAIKHRADALGQTQATFLEPYQQRIIDLAAKNRLPAMYNRRDDVAIGGLMSYGPAERT